MSPAPATRLNILFILYGGLTSNSLNHVISFAGELKRRGHSCVIALKSEKKESLAPLPIPTCAHSNITDCNKLFPNKSPANIIHIWTPRQICIATLLNYLRCTPFDGRVLVHLEDNERLLVAQTAGTAFEELSRWNDCRLRPLLHKGLSHPVRHQLLLAAADAVTLITPRLGELLPDNIPAVNLLPGLDLEIFCPLQANADLRTEIGLLPSERVIVYPGGANLINAAELHTLYSAVVLLNQRGFPVKLVRTGPPTAWFTQSLSPAEKAIVIELGFLAYDRIPAILSLADVLVQPGCPGPFNDYRLPSKLPEFLASGRPVILPATNIASAMIDGEHALFLRDGSPEDICAHCEKLFRQPPLAARLGQAGRHFAERHFDLKTNTRLLEQLYFETLARPRAASWSRSAGRLHDEADVFPLLSGRATSPAIEEMAALRRQRGLFRRLARRVSKLV